MEKLRYLISVTCVSIMEECFLKARKAELNVHLGFIGWGDFSRLALSSEQIVPATIRFSDSPLRFVELRPGFVKSPRPEE